MAQAVNYFRYHQESFMRYHKRSKVENHVLDDQGQVWRPAPQ